MSARTDVPVEERLIAALDVPSLAEARAVAEALRGAVRFFKIGLQLFPLGGVELARELSARGDKVFLDFKFYDIGETVRNAVTSAASIGAQFLTVHGDREILSAAVAGRGNSELKILCVTVLTSLDQAALKEMGYSGTIGELVVQRALTAQQAGCDGVIASAQEAARLRAVLGPDMLIVTPGIRPTGGAANDQKRVMTPGEALQAGADFLVVGRPIVKAEDPRAAAEAILAEMRAACSNPGY
ncbi:MAG: orotidine-5'-phosphate decarboxylase [Alphaproteobacteria bacterium]|nr:orotidine-5'-phosphate decarboxylase [Alphaproteobacteria bacterium]